MEFSEEEKGSESTPNETEKAPENGSKSDAPQPLFKKVLWWVAFAVLVVVCVVLVRVSFPPAHYNEFLELKSVSGFDVQHFVRLVFSLVWLVLFFAVLRKFPLWVRGIVFVGFFFLPVFALYVRKYYGMEFGFSLLSDFLNTHWGEAKAFISFHAIATLVAFVALMFVAAWVVGKVPAKLPKSRIFILAGIVVLVFSVSLPTFRPCIFTPKIAFEAGDFLKRYNSRKLGLTLLARQEDEPQEFSRIPAEVSHVNAVPVVVLHIGETSRADHAPFNGYPRNTMPNMLKEYEAGNLVSFPKCVSFSIRTGVSMRGILSPSTVLDNAFRHPTFIPVLNQSGVETRGFLSGFNQNGFHDSWIGLLLGRLQEVTCTRDSAFSMLPKIRETIATDAKEEPVHERFYLYYGEGSHEPFTSYDYERHAVFKPNGTRKYGDERDVNNYDNTFIAVDEFCGELIDDLRNENAVYVFVGDHGNMLGEDGIQGRPYRRPESRHVLFFIWGSEKFKAENPEIWATLVRNRERLGVVSHDFLYNSILHLFSLKTPFYDEKADLFSDAAEPFPTEMPEAEGFGPMRFGDDEKSVHIEDFD